MSDNNDIAVKVDNVTKFFKLPHDKRNTIKSNFINIFKGQSYEEQVALDDVSFEVKKGEFYGIVGRNGSGKSTMLKMLAGIYVPTKGKIQIRGKLIPFIELGVGFNNELTGRENVYLNGALLGYNRKEMDEMYDDIVSFAEIERFMDQKLKNYSSGMQVRLAFSIAIRAQGDILLLDEVLAVGDSAFQQKCFDYFHSIKKEKKTIILVSHNMQIIEQFCDKAMLLEQSKVRAIGSSGHIASLYEDLFIQDDTDKLKKEGSVEENIERKIRLKSINLKQKNKEVKQLDGSLDFEVDVTIEAVVDLPKINIGINFKTHDRTMLISKSTQPDHEYFSISKGQQRTVNFKIQNILTNGVYTLNLGVSDNTKEAPRMLLKKENAYIVKVEGKASNVKGLVRPDITTTIK